MSINHEDLQMPSATAHVYMLQMDSSLNLGSSEQVLPLHLLDNSLEYGRNQYSLPISTKQKDRQDQLQVLIDTCQEPNKIMGILVDKNYHGHLNMHTLPSSNIQPILPSIAKSSNNEDLSIRSTRPDMPKLNIKTEEICNEDDQYQSIQHFVHISDRIVPPRALAVLPSVLQIQRRHIIAARRTLPIRARFGPVQGIKHNITQEEAVELILNATSNKKALFLVKDDNNLITHIDTSDKDKSNWISLLSLGDQKSANVWLYEENHELYAITTEVIPPRKVLMLGYSKQYADDYGLVGPTKDIEKVSQGQKPWWCYECQCAFRSSNLLQRHMDSDHREDMKVSRRRYRCGHCSRSFCRLFTLRRHMTLHCPNISDKRNNTASKEPEPQINLNASLCSEDNRIPSDESFQNYSNGLDFSTNLFDTDRIPNLDISGTSRSENEFNPYGIGYKDDNGLSNDLDFPSRTENSGNSRKQKKSKPVEQFLVTCPYCNQTIVKEKRRLHVSECPARRFECECKKVFTNKQKLANHIFTHHSNEQSSKNDTDIFAGVDTKDNSSPVNTTPQGLTPYKCEQCQHIFKRRGMLVNHLWRVHNTVSARVPLERRVRHYPCVSCSKVYRTAAKRNKHVLLHHPGAVKIRGQALEGGTRVCEPAMCSACPRQYATRAKLLQHQRAHHPHLVPPTSHKIPLKRKSGKIVSS